MREETRMSVCVSVWSWCIIIALTGFPFDENKAYKRSDDEHELVLLLL